MLFVRCLSVCGLFKVLVLLLAHYFLFACRFSIDIRAALADVGVIIGWQYFMLWFFALAVVFRASFELSRIVWLRGCILVGSGIACS